MNDEYFTHGSPSGQDQPGGCGLGSTVPSPSPHPLPQHPRHLPTSAASPSPHPSPGLQGPRFLAGRLPEDVRFFPEARSERRAAVVRSPAPSAARSGRPPAPACTKHWVKESLTPSRTKNCFATPSLAKDPRFLLKRPASTDSTEIFRLFLQGFGGQRQRCPAPSSSASEVQLYQPQQCRGNTDFCHFATATPANGRSCSSTPTNGRPHSSSPADGRACSSSPASPAPSLNGFATGRRTQICCPSPSCASRTSALAETQITDDYAPTPSPTYPHSHRSGRTADGDSPSSPSHPHTHAYYPRISHGGSSSPSPSHTYAHYYYSPRIAIGDSPSPASSHPYTHCDPRTAIWDPPSPRASTLSQPSGGNAHTPTTSREKKLRKAALWLPLRSPSRVNSPHGAQREKNSRPLPD